MEPASDVPNGASVLVYNLLLDALQAKESTGLDKALIPDTLHPSPEGMEKLAQCLQPHLRRAGISPAAAHRHLLAAAGT